RVVFGRLVGPGPQAGGVNIGDYDLYVYDIGTGTETEISNNEAADFVPEWSPDGNKIIFINLTDNQEDAYDIYTTNPDGTGRKKVTGDDPPSFVENGCSWLDGKILFTAEWYE
ncbi:MAG: DPP IV N-terminal domain-containing protein, partial [Candidatus Aenigmatarchaeota archaeon]